MFRADEIELSILEFRELWGEKPESGGDLLFRTKCLPITFAEAVHKAANQILVKLGESGYAEKWSMHPFPSLQYQEIGRLLKIENREA